MLYRLAKREDLPAIVAILANDPFGRFREQFSDPLPASYYKAFDRIDADPAQELTVAVTSDGEVVGTLQITFIPYLLNQGSLRAQVEGFWVREDKRGQGIGEGLMLRAIDRAKAMGAYLIQLTSNKERPDAHRFYERMGFQKSHFGFKMLLAKGE